MSEVYQPNQYYDWWEVNPSEAVSLPVIPGHIYEPGGECAWISEQSLETEEMLLITEEYYRDLYPNLFNQLSAFSSLRANTPSVFYDSEATMRHYYQGAVIAIRSIEASLIEEPFQDISHAYVDVLTSLDTTQLEWWLLCMKASTPQHRKSLERFMEQNAMSKLDESQHLNIARRIGAEYAYILSAHHRGCMQREKELAWEDHNDQLLHGWLAYRFEDI